MAWGNLTGIRVDGHLFELNSSLCVVGADGNVFTTGREKQTNSYSREGVSETVAVQMRGKGWSVNAKEIIADAGRGAAKVDITFDSPKPTGLATYWCLDLPQFLPDSGPVAGKLSHLRLLRGHSVVDIAFGEPARVKSGPDALFRIEVATHNSFTIEVTGDIDHSPVTISLDAAHPGQRFDGMGGNFRLQNPKADPGIIDYNLENLRVAWGRVEMPWRSWQPDERSDPLAAARAGTLDPHVGQAMEMARRLAAKGMPLIVSAWFPPKWAILPDRREGCPGIL